MTEVSFYHLTKFPVEKALPKLMEKVITSGSKVILRVNNEEQVEFFDKVFWTYTTKFFLPHGTGEDKYTHMHPIYITSKNVNPINADILAIIDNSNIKDLDKYSKCLFIFDGNDNSSVTKAREFYKELKSNNFKLSYWQQDKKGSWKSM